MRIYLTAPEFNQAERKFNTYIKEKLEANSFEVFLAGNKAKAGERESQIFASDIFAVILDDRSPAKWQQMDLGLARAHKALVNKKKLIAGYYIGLGQGKNGDLPDYVRSFCDRIVNTEKDFLNLVKTYMVVSRKAG